jgi:hypothetical protein
MHVVALRAKTNPCMKRSTSIIPLLATLFAGLCSTTLHAQLAQLHTPALDVPEVRTTATPIHDDGDDLFHLEQGTHVLLAYQSSSAGERIVELLDEQGRAVRSQRQQAGAGAQLVPFELGTLTSGRYLLRVQHGDALKQTRIVRP